MRSNTILIGAILYFPRCGVLKLITMHQITFWVHFSYIIPHRFVQFNFFSRFKFEVQSWTLQTSWIYVWTLPFLSICGKEFIFTCENSRIASGDIKNLSCLPSLLLHCSVCSCWLWTLLHWPIDGWAIVGSTVFANRMELSVCQGIVIIWAETRKLTVIDFDILPKYFWL